MKGEREGSTRNEYRKMLSDGKLQEKRMSPDGPSVGDEVF